MFLLVCLLALLVSQPVAAQWGYGGYPGMYGGYGMMGGYPGGMMGGYPGMMGGYGGYPMMGGYGMYGGGKYSLFCISEAYPNLL